MRQLQVLAIAAVVGVVTTFASEQSKTPAGWKWRTDGPTAAAVVDTLDPKSGSMTFAAMPPGWHVTTGPATPATLLYHPDYQTRDTQNFAVEAEIFLFPGTSQEEYGIFIAGKGLTQAERESYLAFVARRDGQGMIRRGSGEPIVPWKANGAINPQGGTENARNVLRVQAGPTEIIFSANGKEVARVPRQSHLDGHLGLRIGKDINVHISRLDVTYKLAPVK